MPFLPSLEWIAVFLAVVLLLGGLSLLALRRRNEILQDYLTPEDTDSDSRLFKRRHTKRPVHEMEKETESTEEKPEPTDEAPADHVTWGTPGEGDTP